jgi:serine O-acetyltransferase
VIVCCTPSGTFITAFGGLTKHQIRTGVAMDLYSTCRDMAKSSRASLVLPHQRLFRSSSSRDLIAQDVGRWAELTSVPAEGSLENQLTRLLLDFPEFRNLFYHRLGYGHRADNWATFQAAKRLLKPLSTLYLSTESIGPGLVIWHGFSTIISARAIGRDCLVFQQVTIGYTNATDRPTLGNNVTVYAGAIVVGDITLGDNCVVGAGAVVVDDVPAGATVVSPKARIIETGPTD